MEKDIEINDLDKLLKDTSIYQKLLGLKKIYDELDIKTRKFMDNFDIHCLKGCGECCKNFIPDLTNIEALYIAYGLIAENKDQIVIDNIKDHKNLKTCPFFSEFDDYHCKIYKYRPLVCRLFGSSASNNKEDKPIYRKCKWNKKSHDLNVDELIKDKDKVITMSEYGLKVDEIESEITEKELLTEIIDKEIYKIKYLIEIMKETRI